VINNRQVLPFYQQQHTWSVRSCRWERRFGIIVLLHVTMMQEKTDFLGSSTLVCKVLLWHCFRESEL
jgi:hypothetical protein